MEASFLRLLGNQLQRNIIKSGSTCNSNSKLFRQLNNRGGRIPGCMSFSASSSLRRQQTGLADELIVKSDREADLLKGVAITDYLFEDLGKWSDATAMVSRRLPLPTRRE